MNLQNNNMYACIEVDKNDNSKIIPTICHDMKTANKIKADLKANGKQYVYIAKVSNIEGTKLKFLFEKDELKQIKLDGINWNK